jgi:hypothetical protein
MNPDQPKPPQQPRSYETIADLPVTLPLFPLPGALLFAREILPLNVFEPRYLAMVNAALAGDRMIGIIQPAEEPANMAAEGETQPELTPELLPELMPELMKVGCAARLISFQETTDNRYLITLRGVCRFEPGEELPQGPGGFRRVTADYARFNFDLAPSEDAGRINRKRLLEVVKTYLENNNMDANWDVIHQTPDESLVNYLCMVSPFGIRERQALLEADSLVDRTDMMIALAEMLIAQGEGPETPVH